MARNPTTPNLNRRWNAEPGAIPYPMVDEAPAHPAYVGTAVDTAVWLKRWDRLADRRCLDADLYAAYDPHAHDLARKVAYPQVPQRRLPL